MSNYFNDRCCGEQNDTEPRRKLSQEGRREITGDELKTKVNISILLENPLQP